MASVIEQEEQEEQNEELIEKLMSFYSSLEQECLLNFICNELNMKTTEELLQLLEDEGIDDEID